MNGTLTKWLITTGWQHIIKIGFQYSKSTDPYLSFDMKIIQIGPHTPELQSFENDNIMKL